MGSNREGDFEQNMEQLIHLIKKIMRTHPEQGQLAKLKSLFQDQGININLCFLNFFPITADELDELEEICEQYLSDDSKRPEDLTTDLSIDDLDFLRRNGIRF